MHGAFAGPGSRIWDVHSRGLGLVNGTSEAPLMGQRGGHANGTKRSRKRDGIEGGPFIKGFRGPTGPLRGRVFIKRALQGW